MSRNTPFHLRTEPLNRGKLWTHWAGYLSATRYGDSEKFEYFAIRNGVGIFDTSPLYKYRILGADAERFLARVLTRDVRTCRRNSAQYTLWCDERGFVVEDGLVIRRSSTDFLLTSAEPNLSYFSNLMGSDRVEIEDVTDEIAAVAVQGPRSREVLASLCPDVERLDYFHATETTINAKPATITRTGFTGDLGYEIWVPNEDAVELWDSLMEAGAAYGILPFGQTALLMARIEAGLLLLGVDFKSSRYAWTDTDRSTPDELGLGWMLRGTDTDDRSFIGRNAILQERQRQPRWKTVGIKIDWKAWDELYARNGLMPPKDHTPNTHESILYDDAEKQIGYTTSLMYSPMAQRHIALAKVRPDSAALDTKLKLEVTINHTWQSVDAQVTQLPFYNPDYRTG